jgi:Na+-transporting methylmalonyl-CoA/oxaloacetate decarboxylase gamma subunit
VNFDEHESPESQIPQSTGAPPPSTVSSGRIQWGLLFRTASPLAIVTGVATFLFFPVGLLLVLPFNLKRIITRYRPLHRGTLNAGQGALAGIFMAFLSFLAFVVFFFATLSVNRGPMLNKLHEIAMQNPDPQAQQIMLWYTSNDGFPILIAFVLLFFLVLFLVAGGISGALITRSKRPGLAP